MLIDGLGVFPLNVYIDIDTKRRFIKSAEDATMKFISGKQTSLSTQSANLYEFKDQTHESTVHLDGVAAIRSKTRNVSFVDLYKTEVEDKKSCRIM